MPVDLYAHTSEDEPHAAEEARVQRAVKMAVNKWKTYKLHALPQWAQDNQFLLSGYRHHHLGWSESAKSVCRLHNETFNVWTHLAGAFAMLVLFVLTMTTLSSYGVDRLSLSVMPIVNYYAFGSTGEQTVRPLRLQPEVADLVRPVCQCSCLADGVVVATQLPFAAEVTSPLERDCFMCCNHAGRVKPFEMDAQHIASLSSTYSTPKPSPVVPAPVPTPPETADSAWLSRLNKHLSHAAHIATSLRDQMENTAKAMKESSDLSQQSLQAGADVLYTSLAAYLHNVVERSERLKADLTAFGAAAVANITGADGGFIAGVVHAAVDPMLNLDPLAAARSLLDDFSMSVFAEQALTNTSGTTVPTPAQQEMLRSELERKRPLLPAVFVLTVPAQKTAVAGYAEPVSGSVHLTLPVWPIAVFLLSAMACMGFSCTFHLFYAVSLEWASNFMCLDYGGICLLISGSAVPVVYYGLYCHTTLVHAYIWAYFLLGAGGFLIVVLPQFRDIKYRTLKLAIFVSMGLSGVVPAFHISWLNNMQFVPLTFDLVIMGVFYLGGALIYLLFIPERWFPGFFDIYFHSHQLWHLCIFAATLWHYFAALRMYEWRMHTVCPA